MPAHPYISGAGNISQMIVFLRKSFPAAVTSETVKKLGLAPNNESYVINALQFIGVIDGEGKRTDLGHQTFTIHDDGAFQKAFEKVVRDAYSDLFELRGDDAWSMNKDQLINYFRGADKTSDVIGTRQAAVFRVFASWAGHGEVAEVDKAKQSPTGRVKDKSSSARIKKSSTKIHISESNQNTEGPSSNSPPRDTPSMREMALTVRVEINLPAEATCETYDNIFKSIKAHLIND
jgi:Family of unknown function (DUF5343)